MSAAAERPRPAAGRPRGHPQLRDAILDAAEARFADFGFAGASLRDIAGDVGANAALVNYYFGTKEALFREAYLRKAAPIAGRRLAGLAALQAAAKPPSTEAILRAFLQPMIDVRRDPAGRAFLRLQARLHTEPMPFAFELRRETYDRSTQAFAAALSANLSHLTPLDIAWRLAQLIGAYLYMVSDAHRLQAIAGGMVGVIDDATLLAQLLAFAVAGFAAPPARIDP